MTTWPTTRLDSRKRPKREFRVEPTAVSRSTSYHGTSLGVSIRHVCWSASGVAAKEKPTGTNGLSLMHTWPPPSTAQFHAAPLDAVTAEDFQAVYASNVLGPILLTQACRPHLPDDRSGRIVSLSSVGNKIGMAGLTLYGGTKGALEAMTWTWARELAEHCTVNAVSVGSTMTDMLAQAPHEAKIEPPV